MVCYGGVMTKILEHFHALVWGAPTLIALLGVGVYLTLRLGFVQIRLFPRAVGHFLRKLRPGHREEGGVSSFQALCTALAATVGTGNLVGVAGAICIGGPGTIFWMWVCGILGMATKFAEVTLAIHYRSVSSGEAIGGPMYMISRGMGEKWHWLAGMYSFFGVVAAFGVGNATQINAVLDGVRSVAALLNCLWRSGYTAACGLLLAALVGTVLLGGARRIGTAAERLVPLASAGYIGLCLVALFLRREAVGSALASICAGAFSPSAVTGGVIASAFTALRVGCSRGVFTNEAGMGTASIAHAAAHVSHPADQGLMGIMEVFLDTLVICTLTALVILSSGVPIPYGVDAGGRLTVEAFTAVCGSWVAVPIAAALCCFAFATVLGWGLYGLRCAEYLFGSGIHGTFAMLQTLTVLLAAGLGTGTVWLLSETVNGLMAIPNLIALAYLTPELIRLTNDYQRKIRQDAGGGIPCKFPSMPTAASRPPCENSIRSRWKRRKTEKESTI